MARSVMLVGGAGYIGSAAAHVLRSHGHEVSVFDDLSTGHRDAIRGRFHQGDIRDTDRLRTVLREVRPDAVMHFAARALVGESMRAPLPYFDVNVAGTISLLRAMASADVGVLVFSGSCAVYGTPADVPVHEELPFQPVSTYGETKAICEQVIARCRAQTGLRATSLRYFNAAGAIPDSGLGERHDPETHLIPLALRAALGRRAGLKLFGTDYPTRDGTCVRDYVHVEDLASAHIAAMEAMLNGAEGQAFNVGTGRGSTVLEVIESVGRAVGSSVPTTPAPRRAGDPAALYADPSRIHKALGWRPAWTHLDDIVASAAAWERTQ